MKPNTLIDRTILHDEFSKHSIEVGRMSKFNICKNVSNDQMHLNTHCVSNISYWRKALMHWKLSVPQKTKALNHSLYQMSPLGKCRLTWGVTTLCRNMKPNTLIDRIFLQDELSKHSIEVGRMSKFNICKNVSNDQMHLSTHCIKYLVMEKKWKIWWTFFMANNVSGTWSQNLWQNISES